MAKDWESHEALIGILFIQILENRRNGGEKSQVAYEEENVGKCRKMKKIETLLMKIFMSISFHIFVSSTFCQFNFGALIFYSLSHALGHLKFCWSTLGGVCNTWDFEKGGKIRSRKHKRTLGSIATIGFSCKYQVPCMISLLVLACMTHACGFLVMVCH